jgi:photosystem II stability/assembly factor-like uncharacterized protein
VPGADTGTGIVQILVDPTSSPSTLYVAGCGFRYIPAALLRTVDGGASWTAIDTGLPDLCIGPFAFDPVAPATLYVAALSNPEGNNFQVILFKSLDAGASWAPVSIPQAPANDFVSLLVSGNGTLYVESVSQGVLASDDGGATWSSLNRGLRDLLGLRPGHLLAADPQSPDKLYRNIYRSGLKTLTRQ